jgi:hypothetical protein
VYPNVVFEVNLREEAEISVDRYTLDVDFDKLNAELRDTAKALYTRFLSEHSSNAYNLVNSAIVLDATKQERCVAVDDNFYWKTHNGDVAGFKKLGWPAVDIFVPVYSPVKAWDIRAVNGTPLNACSPMVTGQHQKKLHLGSFVAGGDLVLCRTGVGVFPGLVWRSASDSKAAGNDGRRATFPEEWKDLLAIQTPYRRIFNSQHPLVDYLDLDVPSSWSGENLSEKDIVAAVDSSETAKHFVAANLLKGVKFWMAVRDNWPKHFESLITSCGLVTGHLAAWFNTGIYDSNYVVFIGRGKISWQPIEQRKGIFIRAKEFELAMPSDDRWWVVLPNDHS